MAAASQMDGSDGEGAQHDRDTDMSSEGSETGSVSDDDVPIGDRQRKMKLDNRKVGVSVQTGGVLQHGRGVIKPPPTLGS